MLSVLVKCQIVPPSACVSVSSCVHVPPPASRSSTAFTRNTSPGFKRVFGTISPLKVALPFQLGRPPGNIGNETVCCTTTSGPCWTSF